MDLFEGGVEGAVGALRDWVGDRPVSPSLVAALFVGAVADGDEKVTLAALQVHRSRLGLNPLTAEPRDRYDQLRSGHDNRTT